ncbi:DUF4184 family protein [Pontibacter chitinilyticus]|uniref:DUF4184 family protein n=1 Tax=Pontibacter chitinilyticus TaxID=2674989 RepID=UPI003218E6A8
MYLSTIFGRAIFSVTGLVIGSIVPDFEYFIRMKKEPSMFSHTFLALFWFNLSLALCLAFLFHGIVKKPFIQNLPQWLFRRFSKYAGWQWYSYF